MIILIGESGTGKTAILNELEKIGYEKVVNYTTRKKRNKEDNEYKFITKKELEKKWENNKLIQKAEFGNEFYGMGIESLKENVVGISIVESVEDIKNKIKELKLHINLKCFYIYTSEEIRKERMKKRGESEESIKKRIEIDKEKFKNVEKVADYVVENREVKDAVKNILEKARI